ncbi:MAG: sugar ABC transporter substrate-binding protein, partial [Pirellula sp.]
LGALALAGSGVSSVQARSGGGGGGASMGGIFGSAFVPPGDLFILRKTPCDGQITIQVDLARANLDPRERILVQPGDILIMRYKPCEEVINFGIGVFFIYGIQYALRGNN